MCIFVKSSIFFRLQNLINLNLKIMKMCKLIYAVILVCTTGITGCAQSPGEVKKQTKQVALTGNEQTIAFYNCENFFDIDDDPLTDDQDFTPGGKYHYTQKIFEQKAHNLAVALQNMPGKDGPAIIGLAEVENNTALNELIKQPEIGRRNYKYVLRPGPDPRGINVALLYNPQQFKVISSTSIPVNLSGMGGKAVTRDVLHVTGILGTDTIEVFVNHWPSRRGGADESDRKRGVAAKTNKNAVQQLLHKKHSTKVIIMGDLNDNPTDNNITQVLGAKANKNELNKPNDLYNPYADLYSRGEGTEQYKQHWNLFDQIIVSGELVNNRKSELHFIGAEIYKPDFLVDHYKGHEGEPHRSFAGTRWINGYSDHFPVLVYLSR
jgi:predicted extracellular nuclease